MLFVIWLQPQETRQAISYPHCLTFLFFGLMLRLLNWEYTSTFGSLLFHQLWNDDVSQRRSGMSGVHFVRSLIPFYYFSPIGEFSDLFLLFGFGFTAADGMVVSVHSILYRPSLSSIRFLTLKLFSPLIFHITDIVIQKIDSFHPWTDYM